MWYASDLGAGSFRCSLLRSKMACLFLRVTGGLHLAVNPLFSFMNVVLNVDCDMSSRVFLTQMLRRCFSEPRKFISCPLRLSSVVLDIKSNPEILFYFISLPWNNDRTVQANCTTALDLIYPRISFHYSVTVRLQNSWPQPAVIVWVFFFFVVVVSLSQATADALRVEFNYVYLEKCIHVNFSASFFTFWCRGTGRTHFSLWSSVWKCP